jgi:hypothetical protein
VIQDPGAAIPAGLLSRSYKATYSEAERRAHADGFVSLIHVFDNATAPLYIDAVHVGPEGNQALASAMAALVASDLQDKKP